MITFQPWLLYFTCTLYFLVSYKSFNFFVIKLFYSFVLVSFTFSLYFSVDHNLSYWSLPLMALGRYGTAHCVYTIVPGDVWFSVLGQTVRFDQWLKIGVSHLIMSNPNDVISIPSTLPDYDVITFRQCHQTWSHHVNLASFLDFRARSYFCWFRAFLFLS